MSDKSDDILKSLGKLKPDEMREVIENLARQSGTELEKAQLAHLPNRLSCEDIIDRATINDKYTYWHIVSSCGLFNTMVDFRDAQTEEQAIKFAFNPQELQAWYSTFSVNPSFGYKAKQVSSKEFKAWVRKE